MNATIEIPRLSIDLIARAKKSETPIASLPDAALLEIEDRYRIFLFLIQTYSDVAFAPSKDIDEMWHLHMLKPRAYYEDCETRDTSIPDGFTVTHKRRGDGRLSG